MWGVSHVGIRECDMMGAIAKGKLKFLLPPEKQWSVLLATFFSWSFNHEIALPVMYFLTTSKTVSAFLPHLGLFVLLEKQ